MRDIIPFLPHFHATLNLITAILISLAYYHIRKKNKVMHRKNMIAALIVSSVFMISYMTYHNQVGYAKFMGEGIIRPIYFTILASHIILAVFIIPLTFTTVFFAWRVKFMHHRRLGRWTLPVWIYVSISGILVYLMAFHIYLP